MLGEELNQVQKRKRSTREQRQKQIAEVTLDLVAKYGVLGATISRISSAIGLTRAALYRFFPDRDAMLEAALDVLVKRLPTWIDQASGRDAYEHLMDMGRQYEPMCRAGFESFTRPWFQFIVGSGEEHIRSELAKRQLVFIRDCTLLIEQGKRDGSIREDADTNLIAWSLLMWGWASDVARLAGLEQMMGEGTSLEIFKRMLSGIAAASLDDEAGDRNGREVPAGMVGAGTT